MTVKEKKMPTTSGIIMKEERKVLNEKRG